jgi:hypothetical protein
MAIGIGSEPVDLLSAVTGATLVLVGITVLVGLPSAFGAGIGVLAAVGHAVGAVAIAGIGAGLVVLATHG